MSRVSGTIAGLSLVLACHMAAAQATKPACPHFQDKAAPIYSRSAFAHGYIHGYEDGFHAADQDLHMGRLARGIAATKPAGHPERRVAISDRTSFRKGYTQGFNTGYSDGASGREFRAIDDLRIAAADLSPGDPDPIFDRAFQQGYGAGRQYVINTTQPIADFSYAAGYCSKSLNSAPQKGDTAGVCNAYARGFRLGYDDGQLARSPQHVSASAR